MNPYFLREVPTATATDVVTLTSGRAGHGGGGGGRDRGEQKPTWIVRARYAVFSRLGH